MHVASRALDPQPRLVHVGDLRLPESLLDLDLGQQCAAGAFGNNPP
jgi:hypothetical protein